MPKITIKGTIIDIPNSGGSPNWAPAIIEAFQAIADTVNLFTGTFDVAPQTIVIDAYNPGVNIDIDNLVFPATDVRAATVYYTVYRKTEDTTISSFDAIELAEAGTLEIVYNNSRTSGSKWEVGRSGEGDASVIFTVTDLGQIQLTTETVTGINHTGILSYRAITILN
jgi:hypothetical protein